MNRLTPIVLLLTILPLTALEIRLNDRLYDDYSNESLTDLSYRLPDGEDEGIYLNELLPLMEEIHRFRLYSGDYILETDPAEDLRITISGDGYFLKGSAIGSIPLPRMVEIEGIQREPDKLIIWFDREDRFIEREIDLFARLHRIEVEYRVDKGLISLLEYNSFNEKRVPDLIIFTDEKLNRLSPLLVEEKIENPDLYEDSWQKAVPFKTSRQVFLSGSSGGENRIVTADFGDPSLFYPLAGRFGLEGVFSTDQEAVQAALFYLRDLYRQGVYRLSNDPVEDFISGKADRIYGSSTMFSRLPGDPIATDGITMPHLGGEAPLPLLRFVLLSRPGQGEQREIAGDLMDYLTGYSVQQRIDPGTGFLPANKSVYNLLRESLAKDLLMADLDQAIRLPSDELHDKLNFVLPKIYRLVITDRLTIEEGMAEIDKYLAE